MLGRILFGVSMLGFGALHFLYIPYVANVIPNWIPAHVGFANATGAAHIAVLCMAAMCGSWVLIVFAPRVFAHPQNPSEWTSMSIALGTCGGALPIARAAFDISRAPASAAASTSASRTPFAV